MKEDYKVTADVLGHKNVKISECITKSRANQLEKRLKKEIREAIPKYKWATNIKVVKGCRK